MNRIVIARYVCDYEDEMPLSSCELVFRSKEDALKYLKIEEYAEDEIDIDTAEFATGWQIMETDFNL